MIKKLLFCLTFLLLFSTNATAQSDKQAEIFDVSKGKVISNVPVNSEIKQEVEKFLKGITGVSKKFEPIPNKGFMVKVPLEPAVMLQNQWVNGLVDEVIIIFPGQDQPYLMVFDDENKPYFLTFKGKTDTFLTKLKFKPKTSE